MGRKAIDHTGERFGRLVAIRKVPTPEHYSIRNAWWEFQCDCGNTHSCNYHNVQAGKTKSCGCLRREHAKTLAQYRNKCTEP